VTSIGNEAFYGCSKLSYVSLPSSIDVIGGHAFSNYEDLKEIIIPNGTRQKFKEQLPEYLHDKLKELKQ